MNFCRCDVYVHIRTCPTNATICALGLLCVVQSAFSDGLLSLEYACMYFCICLLWICCRLSTLETLAFVSWIFSTTEYNAANESSSACSCGKFSRSISSPKTTHSGKASAQADASPRKSEPTRQSFSWKSAAGRLYTALFQPSLAHVRKWSKVTCTLCKVMYHRPNSLAIIPQLQYWCITSKYTEWMFAHELNSGQFRKECCNALRFQPHMVSFSARSFLVMQLSKMFWMAESPFWLCSSILDVSDSEMSTWSRASLPSDSTLSHFKHGFKPAAPLAPEQLRNCSWSPKRSARFRKTMVQSPSRQRAKPLRVSLRMFSSCARITLQYPCTQRLASLANTKEIVSHRLSKNKTSSSKKVQ